MSHQKPNTSSSSHHPITPPPANRRSFLQWMTHGMGAIFAAVLGVPAALYLLDPRHQQATAGTFTRLTEADKLKVNQPQEFVIRQTYQDAWTLHPNEIVGRVLVIKKDATTCEAYNTVCPHLGCSIKINTDRGRGEVAFICPCHGGRFEIDGKRVLPNPAKRDMYNLECRVTDGIVEVKFEKPKLE
jgi:menaquinol-cytochrome c reductase iron-sulfur subunit